MEAYIVYPTKEQEKAIEAFFEALEVPFEKRSDRSATRQFLTYVLARHTGKQDSNRP